MKNLSLMTVAALAFLLALPSLAGAQPGSSPPTGIVDANFNSVNVTANGSFGSDVDVGGDLQVTGFSQATTAFKLTGAGTFIIDQVGNLTRFYDNTAQPLNLFDANGVTFGGPLWTGPTSSDAKPIVVSDPDGLRVTTYGGTKGLEIAATGALSDSNSDVTIDDRVDINGGVAFGPLIHATGVPGTFLDVMHDGWLRMTGGLHVGGSGFYPGNLLLASSGQISSNIGAVTVADDLTVTGKLKAVKLGGVTRYSASKNIAASSFDEVAVGCPTNYIPLNCGYTSYAPVDTWYVQYQYMSISAPQCHVYVYNKKTSTQSIDAEVYCLNPNG